jgi:hypothetical protein
MKLSTTRLALLLVLIVCLVTSSVLAKHDHHGHDDDCDEDHEDCNEDWEDEDHADWDHGNDWDNNNDWNDNGQGWNNNGQGWNNNGQGWNSNGQGWTTGSTQYGNAEVTSTVWSGSGYPMPTYSNGQSMYYPSGARTGVATATWTQVMTATGRPTNIYNGQFGSSARYK